MSMEPSALMAGMDMGKSVRGFDHKLLEDLHTDIS
jgi:hypothetical protein